MGKSNLFLYLKVKGLKFDEMTLKFGIEMKLKFVDNLIEPNMYRCWQTPGCIEWCNVD